MQGLDAAGAAGVGGVAAALLQLLHRGGRRGVLGRRGAAAADGERGGAAERADLVEPDAAEAEHGVARSVRAGQRHRAARARTQRVHAPLVVVGHHGLVLPAVRPSRRAPGPGPARTARCARAPRTARRRGRGSTSAVERAGPAPRRTPRPRRRTAPRRGRGGRAGTWSRPGGVGRGLRLRSGYDGTSVAAGREQQREQERGGDVRRHGRRRGGGGGGGGEARAERSRSRVWGLGSGCFI